MTMYIFRAHQKTIFWDLNYCASLYVPILDGISRNSQINQEKVSDFISTFQSFSRDTIIVYLVIYSRDHKLCIFSEIEPWLYPWISMWIFHKFKVQGQFWNLLAIRVQKLSLTEIFKVKGKAQFPIHLEKQAT